MTSGVDYRFESDILYHLRDLGPSYSVAVSSRDRRGVQQVLRRLRQQNLPYPRQWKGIGCEYCPSHRVNFSWTLDWFERALIMSIVDRGHYFEDLLMIFLDLSMAL